jgi:phosphopantetheine adenylyltransferase
MARMNRQIAPKVDTLFMMSTQTHTHISSTLAMEVALMSNPRISREQLVQMVPPIVIEFIERKFFKLDRHG